MDNEAKVKLITDKILEDSESEINEIKGRAEKEASKILNEAKGRATEIRETILKEGKREAEQERKRIIADAVIKARKKKLEAREEVISKTFEEGEERIKKILKRKDYSKILENLIQESAIEIGGGDLVVILRDDDKRLVELDKIARDLKEKVKITGMKLSKDSIASPGVIVRTKDGRVEVDNTLETRMRRMRNDLRLKVAKVLF